jgi:hypothetical protein
LLSGRSSNIGVFLHCPQARFLDCEFTQDFRDVLRIHPQADIEFLGELQAHFEQEISDNEQRLAEYVRGMQESYSNLVQISDTQPTVADDLEARLNELFRSYVRSDVTAARRPDTRMRIKQRLAAELERHGLMDHELFQKDVPAAHWIEDDEGFNFDFAYTMEHPTRQLKVIHALSLTRDALLAERLVSKFQAVLQRQPAQLIVAHEDIDIGSEMSLHFWPRVPQEGQVLLVSVSGFDEFARSVRSELFR